jgi:NitT/TauT family transport system substrate-binding protein
MKLAKTLLLSLAFSASAALAQTKVVLGYTAVPDFAAAFIAKERGIFEKHGLDVQLQLITLTSNVPAALISNSIQIGGTTPPVMLQAIGGGLDMVGLVSGSLYNNAQNPPFIGIVARTESGVTLPNQLAGKKLGVPGLGGTLDILARRWLIDKGVDLKSITFIEVPLPQMADVLRGGNVDAVVTPEPFLSRIRSAAGGTALSGFAQEMPNGFATVVYTASRKWAEANPKAVTAFRDAVGEAIVFAAENPAEAYVDLGKYFKVPPAVLKTIQLPQFASDMKPEHLGFWADTMVRLGTLKKAPVLADVIAK